MDDGRGEERTPLKSVTRIDRARGDLLDAIGPHDRIDRVAPDRAVGRALAEAVTAPRNHPPHDRIDVDGFAVRAATTTGATDRAPVEMALRTVGSDDGNGDTDGDGTRAVAVAAGDAVPAHTDAVVPVGGARPTDEGDRLVVFESVPEGAGLTRAGGSITAGERLFTAGDRLRPGDAAVCRALGIGRVVARDPPTVGVVPIGDQFTVGAPAPGEAIETDAGMLTRLIDTWGGVATQRNPVPPQPTALRAALERDLTRDVIVTTGATGPGTHDRIPDVLAEVGERLVYGVAMDPGRTVALGTVRDTPVVCCPGAPAAALTAAVVFLRPVLDRVAGAEGDVPTGTVARVDRKLRSTPGVRTFARVRLTDHGADAGDGDHPTATPLRIGGAGDLGALAAADGWVVIPESAEGIPAGDRVTVERWQRSG